MIDDRLREDDGQRLVRRLDELVAHARFAAALDALHQYESEGPVPAALESPLLLAQCRSLLGLGRWKEVAEVAEKKLEELYALRPEEKKTLLEFHIAAGRAAWRLGRPGRAEEHFRAAYHISRWDLEDMAAMLRARNLLGLCFLSAGELHRAASEFGRGQVQARGAGLYHEEANFSLNLSIALAKLGRIEPSGIELGRARSLFGERGHSRGRVLTRLCTAQTHRLRGEMRDAEAHAMGALSEAEEHGFEREHVIALEYLGDVALDQHDNQAAIEHYDQALVLAERLAPEGDLIPELCRRMGEIHVRIGEPNRALVTCERGLRIARRINDRFEEAATHRVMAMAHLRLGHREKAVRVAAEGIAQLRRLEALHELMRVLVLSGEILLAGGDSEDRRNARDHLWEARSLAMTMKLDRWIERIEKVLGVELAPRLAVPPTRVALPEAPTPEGAHAGCFRYGIITQDPRLIELVHVLERASASRLPVLILGESGTGKELLARAAHQLSDRAPAPFIVSHCAALPDGQFEGELFGVDPNVESGGRGPSPGLFEIASRGVLFLDEVSELLMGAQAKLLRVIEMGELRRVGATGSRQVDVRVVAASTRDLGALVRRGLFRDDLYYRLNGIRLEVPPLRERPGDVELIARHLLLQACARSAKEVAFSEEAWTALLSHGWPGNARELRNVVDRAVALTPDGASAGVDALQLGAPGRSVPSRHGAAPRGASADTKIERDAIVRALLLHRGNQSEAARSLGGMKRTTLLYKIKKLDIRPEEYGVSGNSRPRGHL
jgi:DNA-binding NtrC family response regulator/tetratricopeptide (TPR) repeat protein